MKIMARSFWISSEILLLVLLGVLTCVSSQDYPGESYSSVSVSSVGFNNRRPCSFRGNTLIHKQSTLLDLCTDCTCFSGTTYCNIESCPRKAGCQPSEIVVIPEACCPQCPYKMVVVHTTNRYGDTFTFTEEESKIIRFKLGITVDKKLSSRIVRGEDLWKVSAWISPNNDGSGEKYSFVNNVLTWKAAAKEFLKADYPPWEWSKLKYYVTFKGGTCADYKYFCVRFGMGEDPRPTYDLNFSLRTVDDGERRLVDCVPLGPCTEKVVPCAEENTVREDKCTTCMCVDGVLECTDYICVISECDEGNTVEEECCPVSSYDLHVEQTEIILYDNTTFSVEMEQFNVTFDMALKIEERRSSRFVRGKNLWKLTAWTSSHRNGAKHQLRENLFSEEDSSKSYEKCIGNPSYMMWENLVYEIDFVGDCEDFKVFCVQFGREAEPAPTHEVDFTVSSDIPDQLVDCQELGKCTENIYQGLIDVNILAVIICFSTILIFLLGSAILVRMRRRKRKHHVEHINFSGDTGRVDLLLQANEISSSQVTLGQEVGKGEYGIVFQGVVTGLAGQPHPKTVAVKTIKDNSREVQEDFLEEMKLLASLGEHRNILSLIACCSRRYPMYIITDYMKYGDLLGFLRKCREISSPTIDPIFSFGETEQIIVSREIANGMAFLESKGICHGDLAARNVLVGEGLQIKISDFGLSDDIYSRGYKRREESGKKIPVKWCSPETIFSGICSSKSDVWSFGVVMHEIFTLGGTPYPGMALHFFVSKLKDGYRMEKADNCPEDLYRLMVKCWQLAPQDRPKFSSIFEELGDSLTERCDYCEFSIDEDLLETKGEQSHGATSDICDMLHPIEADDGEADMMELLKVIKDSKKEPSQKSIEDAVIEM